MKNLTKHLLAMCLILLMSTSMYAQSVPQGMKYQAVARDLDGTIITDKVISLEITLQSEDGKSSEVHYIENHDVTTNKFGLFSLVIGEGLPTLGKFNGVPWSTDEIWMSIGIKEAKGSSFTIISSTKLLAVPYAFHSGTANELISSKNNQAESRNGVPSQVWSLKGNSKTDPKRDKLGTTDAADLVMVTNDIERLRITADGEIITGDGKFTIGGNLEVQGDSTTINKDLFVGRNVELNYSDEFTPRGETINYGDFTVERTSSTVLTGTLDVFEETVLKNTLNVIGDGTFEDDLYVNDTLFANNIVVNRLNIKDNVADGEYLATFENTNAGNGDGIKIKLGKKGIKNNSTLVTADGALGEWVGGIDLTELNSIRGLLDGNLSSDDANYMFDKAIPDPDEAAEMLLQIGATACFMGQTVVNLIITKAIDPIIEEIDVAGVICTYYDDGPNDEWDEGEYYCIGSQDFGCENIGEPFSFPTLNLDNISNVLTNENVFIEFTDKDDKHVGAIQGADMEDWLNDYFDKVYLYKLVNSMRGLDKTKLLSEIKEVSAEIAKSYYLIGVEYTSGNGDYAEWLERLDSNELIGTGDIVAVTGGKITKDLTNAEQVMAVSHHPIVLGNVPEKGRNHLGNNIAFMGQIPVKVMGPVETGDYIVGKGDIKGFGVAISPKDMTIEDFKYSVGRSWDTNLESGPKMVNTVVGVHNGDYLNILKRTSDRLKSVEDKVEALYKLMTY
jgi:hypothetical protein